MRQTKNLLSLVLALVMLLSLALPAAAVDSFSDLKGHWAESYMNDLHDRGYLSGYTDGTMKPENAITGCEALVFLSRFYDLSDDELDFIYSDYGDIAERYVPATHKWAYKQAAICLAAGIITQSELKTMDLTKEIEKEQLSVFLIRALGLTDDAEELDGSKLTFSDKADIAEEHLGYIELLVDMGIITGDNNGKFTPHVSVTRAIAATLVSRALDYAEDKELTMEVEGYSGLTRLSGILTNISSKTVQLRSFDGKLREYKLSSDPKIMINGAEKSLSYTYVGCLAELSSIDGKITALSITSDSDVQYIIGRISSVATSTSGDTLGIYDYSTGENDRYKVSDSAKVYLEGNSSGLAKLSKGQFVIAEQNGKSLSKIYAVSGDYELSGKVSAIIYDTTVQFKVEDSSGVVYVFLLDITALPTIKRGSTTITIDRLAQGDAVTVNAVSGAVKTITASSAEKGLTGTLSSITTTAAGTYWTLTDSDDDEVTYQLDTLVGVYSGSKTLSASDIHIGDKITVVIYGSVITEVELESAAVSSDKLTATVLAVNGKTITALLNGKLLYIDGSSATIISFSGKTIKISALETDTVITVYGSYTSSTGFTATSIVVES